jgi:hypothetical protein
MRDNIMDKNLENRIKELENWKREREQQQIAYPIDENSIKILSEYFMRLSETITLVGGVSANETTYFLGKQADKDFIVGENNFFKYTVDTSSDKLTTNVYLDDDTYVIVLSSGTPPSPLVSGQSYYVVNSSGTTFELSASLGGSAIDITTTGSGTQYLNIL